MLVKIDEPLRLELEAGSYLVEANTQMLLYAEGQRIYLETAHNIVPDNYRIHVYQPRMDNVQTVIITPQQLKDFIEAARYRASLVDPDAERTAGEKQCFWCLAKPICKEYAARTTEIARRYFDDIDDADLLPGKLNDNYLTDEQVGELIAQWDEITKMGKALQAYAHARLLQGKKIPGQKLVSGRSSYKPNEAALQFILGDKIDLFKEPAMRSKTDIQKQLGRKVFKILAEPWYDKVEGAPTMADSDDRRAEWTPEDYSSDLEDLSE